MSGLHAYLLKKCQTVFQNGHTTLFPHQHPPWGLLQFLHTLSTLATVCPFLSGYKTGFLSAFVLYFTRLHCPLYSSSRLWEKSQRSLFTSHLWTGEVTDSGTKPSVDYVPSRKHSYTRRNYKASPHPRTLCRPAPSDPSSCDCLGS